MVRWLLIRFGITMLIGLAIAVVINEFSFGLMKSISGRGPQTVTLVIPAGTADKIARGEKTSAIPENIVLVKGDTLKINNQDSVGHELGTLYIPAGTMATLNLLDASNLAYECSFQSSKVLGLRVDEPVTSTDRMYGILIAGIPLGFMMGMYSVVVWPYRKKLVQEAA